MNQYVSVTITDMTDLIPELMYYIRWAEYIEKLREQGAVFSKPVVHTQEGGECEADDFYMKARGIYNTHMHKLAFDIEDMNEEQTSGKAFSLVIHNEWAQWSYKVEIAPPVGKSYASDIAKKYGVTYEMLVDGVD